ncbi:hypothetical protein [Dactylosporangium sp. NPDC005555]|uniref:hypothetical protein n=1 Tax=Dactylosporangium sp. NPDC005555 TaxID=3154889 RepID=UPI0033A448C4
MLRRQMPDGQDEADRVLAEALAGWNDKYPQVLVRRRAVLHSDPAEALTQASQDASMLVVSACSHVGRSEQTARHGHPASPAPRSLPGRSRTLTQPCSPAASPRGFAGSSGGSEQ